MPLQKHSKQPWACASCKAKWPRLHRSQRRPSTLDLHWHMPLQAALRVPANVQGHGTQEGY
jgi:hypothetical protein